MNKNTKNKIAIYTAIFGDYDDLIDPPKEIRGCDFYCFTDNSRLESNVWKIIKVESEFDDKTRDARRIKCLSHKFLPDYEYTLWVDSNIHFKSFDIEKLFKKFLKKRDIAIHRHRLRDCSYDEAEECVRRKLDRPTIIISQIVKYINKGYPARNGLAETSVVFRKNIDKVNESNKDWWDEIRNGSKRDQVSIDYVLWKNNLNYFSISDSVRDGKNFFAKKHKKNKDVAVDSNVELSTLRSKITERDNIISDMRSSGAFFMNDIKDELKKREEQINLMKSSKFWKAREFYIKFKNVIFRNKKNGKRKK